MALLGNAFHTFGAIGNREDLTDLISVISPKETPFYDSIGTTQARATLHEWQNDVLAAANADNVTLEGETFTAVARTATTRKTNYTQIFSKMFTITDTQEIVNKAGRGKESAYQMANAMAEIKRDYEAVIFNYGPSATATVGSTTLGPRMTTLHGWLADCSATTGASAAGLWNVAAANGLMGKNCTAPTKAKYLGVSATANTMNEASFNTLLQAVWNEGGRPNAVYVGGALGRLFAGWATSSSRVWDGSKKVTNAIAVYESMFGALEVKLERHSGSSYGYIVDESLWKKAILKPTGLKTLASRGLGDDYLIWSQWTLESRNTSGNGLFISAE